MVLAIGALNAAANPAAAPLAIPTRRLSELT